ncbi:unnamed protein product [Cercopithifilaria johnstoni]|uniref:FAM192A/Fyv6 N-terminal domain-containing protein n=1 Tax=Cercopithifilaria johnstoni TaxID=2874296 RepID=A0A8J2M402_9BILA|nr:unnamed protein product [Cercopithifilaria johnstoni]
MTDRFVSERELNEAKKKRQEEWEKVRKPTDPEEVPEEKVDNRPLYDRLKEIRDRKQAEYDEEHRFRNMIRGLDADECDFLSGVENFKAKQDLEKNMEEKALLREIDRIQARRNVEDNAPSVSNLLAKPTGGTAPKENKQAAILRMAVKRKSDTGVDKYVEKRPLLSAMSNTIAFPSACKIIDVLPGIANYSSSSNSNSDSNYDSDSDNSSDLPILPVLISNDRGDKKKQLSDCDCDCCN